MRAHRWINHNPARGMPVHPETIVVAVMEKDGHELVPLKAKDINWDDMGDNVARYRIVEGTT